MKRHVLVFLFAVTVSTSAVAAAERCTEMLVETPGSVEARICFTREIEAIDAQITTISRSITRIVTKNPAPFKSVDFSRAQQRWREHVSASCWLDAAGAGNVNAVYAHCETQYKQQRLSQLKNLLASLSGEPILWPMSNLSHEK
jgi:uncharacterized protein YecT (DUF1311 family)